MSKRLTEKDRHNLIRAFKKAKKASDEARQAEKELQNQRKR